MIEPKCSDRTAGSISKVHEGRLTLDIRKHLLTERFVEHCNRILREVVNALKLLLFKKRCHTNLIGHPWSGQAVAPDDHCRSLATKILYSVCSSS